jgi:hypothetical protein
MLTIGEDHALVSEGSVPVSGFSRELRGAADVERFRFSHALAGEAPLPVHIVFSISLRAAEVKTGDMKALRFADVGSAEEVRARWIAWWKGAGGRSRPAFAPPRRTGRHPVVRIAGA